MVNQKQETCIPKISENMFFMVLPKDLREHLIGDLQEEFYQEILPKFGPAKARWWYRRQVLKSIRYYILKKKGDIMFFIFSIIVFVALSIMAALLGKSGVSIFINIPSLIMVIIPSFIFAVAATSTRAWKLGLKLLLVDQDDTEQKDIMEASKFLKVFGNMCVALGIFFTLFGAIQIFNEFDLSSAKANDIFKASSICMLTLFYGIAFKSVLYVADQRLRNRFFRWDN